jgi:F-box protein 36
MCTGKCGKQGCKISVAIYFLKVKKAASGKWDVFLRLGEDLLIAIVSLLDLQSIARLSCVNQHLRETCNCDRLWELLYRTHQGHPSEEIGSLAAELGWKTVFFMNKLQLQKELSRRRREKLGDIESQASDFTFLTES